MSQKQIYDDELEDKSSLQNQASFKAINSNDDNNSSSSSNSSGESDNQTHSQATEPSTIDTNDPSQNSINEIVGYAVEIQVTTLPPDYDGNIEVIPASTQEHSYCIDLSQTLSTTIQSSPGEGYARNYTISTSSQSEQTDPKTTSTTDHSSVLTSKDSESVISDNSNPEASSASNNQMVVSTPQVKANNTSSSVQMRELDIADKSPENFFKEHSLAVEETNTVFQTASNESASVCQTDNKKQSVESKIASKTSQDNSSENIEENLYSESEDDLLTEAENLETEFKVSPDFDHQFDENRTDIDQETAISDLKEDSDLSAIDSLDSSERQAEEQENVEDQDLEEELTNVYEESEQQESVTDQNEELSEYSITTEQIEQLNDFYSQYDSSFIDKHEMVTDSSLDSGLTVKEASGVFFDLSQTELDLALLQEYFNTIMLDSSSQYANQPLQGEQLLNTPPIPSDYQPLLSSHVQHSFNASSAILSNTHSQPEFDTIFSSSLRQQVLDRLAEALQRIQFQKRQNIDLIQAHNNHQSSSKRSSFSSSPTKTNRSETENVCFEIENSSSVKVPDQLDSELQSKSYFEGVPNENGIWYNLAFHIPELHYAGTALLFDFLLRSETDRSELAYFMANKDWSEVCSLMMKCAKEASIKLDQRIIKRVCQLIHQSCRITLIVQQVRAFLTISSSHSENDLIFYHYTEIKFNTVSPVNRKIQSISTKSARPPVRAVKIDLKLFEDVNRWQKAIMTKMVEDPTQINYPLISLNKFKTEYDFPKILQFDPKGPFDFEEELLLKALNILKKGTKLKGLRYYRYEKQKNPNGAEVKNKDLKKLFPQASLKIIIKNLNQSQRQIDPQYLTGKTKIPVSSRLFDRLKPKNNKTASNKQYEYDVETLISQDGVIDAILLASGEYSKGDLIVIRNQVTTFGKIEVKEDNNIVKKIQLPTRTPDFIGLVFRWINNKIKINLIVIDTKRSWLEFKQTIGGYGRGQPFRDLLWFIAKIKEIYPWISEDDIEVTCYTLTAFLDSQSPDSFIIEGEELIRQVPASIVLPFLGKIPKSDIQVYDLAKAISNKAKERNTKRKL